METSVYNPGSNVFWHTLYFIPAEKYEVWKPKKKWNFRKGSVENEDGIESVRQDRLSKDYGQINKDTTGSHQQKVIAILLINK